MKSLKEKLNQLLNEFSQSNELPISLKDKITHKKYTDILDYFLDFKFENTILPVRFPKEETGLARTVNIVKDPVSDNGNIHLLIETKSKLASGEKMKLPMVNGTFKIGKPNVAITSSHPLFMNMTLYHHGQEENLKLIDNEINYPKKVFEHARQLGLKKSEIPILVPAVGADFEKKSDRFDKTFTHKISFYSPWAEGDLIDWCSNRTDDESGKLLFNHYARQVIKAVYLCRQANIFHLDIKPDNFLFYSNHQVKLTDFGHSIDLTSDQLEWQVHATVEYAAPEILCAFNPWAFDLNKTQKSNQTLYSKIMYFWNSGTIDYPNYGQRQLMKKENQWMLGTKLQPSYIIPAFESEVWALGITLHALYSGFFPVDLDDKQVFEGSPWLHSLLKSMLECYPSRRPTVDEVQNIFESNTLPLLTHFKKVDFQKGNENKDIVGLSHKSVLGFRHSRS